MVRASPQIIDEARAKKVLQVGTGMLNTDSPPGDYKCDKVTLNLKQVEEIPPSAPKSLNTASDLDAITKAVGNKPAIVVVNSIRFCGGPTTSAIGCGAKGSAAIVVRYRAQDEDALAEANLWIHEFGHNVGLGHRTNTQRAVMYPSAWKDRDQVTEAECGNYRGAVPLEISGPALTALAADDGTGSPEFRLPVREFVRQSWLEGLPYTMARRYTTVAVPTLLDMLRDPNETDYLGNIAGVLGAIGSQEAVTPLIGFMEAAKATGNLTSEEYAAKTGIPIALGWSTFASGSRQAFAYLSAGANPDYWRARGDIGWRAPYQSSLSERDQDLAAVSIVGLGLTGEREARARLAELAAAFRGKGFQTFATPGVEKLSDNAIDALVTNFCVSSSGLLAYYKANNVGVTADQRSLLQQQIESHVETMKATAATSTAASKSDTRPTIEVAQLDGLLSQVVQCR